MNITGIFFFKSNCVLPFYFTLIVFCCERCDLLCSHSNGDLFTCDDNVLHVISHVKNNNHVFKPMLTWYFIGAYIIK